MTKNATAAAEAAPAEVLTWAEAPTSTFADRLNLLFTVITPIGEPPYRNADVLAALHKNGLRLSGPYLSQLRTGQREGPSKAIVEALATFFGVDTDYLIDRPTHAVQGLKAELGRLRLLQDPQIRYLTTQILELSPAGQAEIIDYLDRNDGDGTTRQPASGFRKLTHRVAEATRLTFSRRTDSTGLDRNHSSE
jgi:transcriptional regulator with XRE-family HTH domain